MLPHSTNAQLETAFKVDNTRSVIQCKQMKNRRLKIVGFVFFELAFC